MTSATRTIKPAPLWQGASFIQPIQLDKGLLWCAVALAVLGWLMVTSASMDLAQKRFDNAFYISFRHGAYLLLAGAVAWVVVHLPLNFWRKLSAVLIMLSLVSLAVVLIPGIGREINGSTRWLSLGFMNLQPSEFAKLATVIYMAGYLERRREEVQSRWSGFLKPLVVLSMLAVLLLLEPDFGAVVVMMATAMALLFLGGVKAGQFFLTVVSVFIASVIILVSQPYRMQRLAAYMDPWSSENVYNGGYQLTQSLIAFGRGEWWGVGLGNSIQKLFYLPEAHTDFVFAIWAEETGMIGATILIGLFAFLFIKATLLGKRAYAQGAFFSAYIAYGMAMLMGFQAFINLGVNMGLLPTKGLTLPLVSYGGSSLLACAIAIALMLRVHHELVTNPQSVDGSAVSNKKNRIQKASAAGRVKSKGSAS